MTDKQVKIENATVEGQSKNKEVIIKDASVEGEAVRIPQQAKAPTTTEQEDITVAGQRRINLIWEITQAIIAVMITGAIIYCVVFKIETKELSAAFFMVVTMYLIRTNHTKVGGVVQGQQGR